jgi:hypothetical protein
MPDGDLYVYKSYPNGDTEVLRCDDDGFSDGEYEDGEYGPNGERVRKRGLKLIYPTIKKFIGEGVGDYASGDEDECGFESDSYNDGDDMEMDEAPTLSVAPAFIASFTPSITPSITPASTPAFTPSFTPTFSVETASRNAHQVKPLDMSDLTNGVGDMRFLPRPKAWDSMDLS